MAEDAEYTALLLCRRHLESAAQMLKLVEAARLSHSFDIIKVCSCAQGTVTVLLRNLSAGSWHLTLGPRWAEESIATCFHLAGTGLCRAHVAGIRYGGPRLHRSVGCVLAQGVDFCF